MYNLFSTVRAVTVWTGSTTCVSSTAHMRTCTKIVFTTIFRYKGSLKSFKKNLMTYNVIRFYFNGLTALFWNMSTYRYCSATHARRFHINSEYGGCPRDVGWLTVVDSDPPGRCGWEMWVGNKSASSTISVFKKQNCEELEFGLVFQKNETFDNNWTCIHLLDFYFSFSIFSLQVTLGLRICLRFLF